MVEFKYPYGSVWISYTSLSDLKKCRRLYILKIRKVKNLKTQIVNPYVTLGEVVHETLNIISKLPKADRFSKPLEPEFLRLWDNFHAIKGGFESEEQEKEFKERGLRMIATVSENPGVLQNPAIRITESDGLPPNYLLSDKESLVLCGNIDWIEVLPDGSLHVIDFKTGNNEDKDILQLQLYMLLLSNKSKRKVKRISFWYLNKYNEPKEVPLPEMEGFEEFLVEKGREMKMLRSQKEVFCAKGGCKYCREYEAIFDGRAEYVGIDPIMHKSCFYLKPGSENEVFKDETNADLNDPYSEDLPF